MAGSVVKVLLLALVNGLAVAALPSLVAERAWAGLAAVVLATVAIDVVYLGKRRLPAKYLVPGTIFLLAFQVFPVAYTGYISVTNYGTGRILDKSQAIRQIEGASLTTPPDAVRYTAVPLARGDDLALLLTDPDGRELLGTPEGLQPVEPGAVERDGDRVVAVGDYERLPLAQVSARQSDLAALRVPVDQGEIQLTTLSAAARREQVRVYDPERDAIVDRSTGTVYRPVEGAFTAEDGTALTPGWRVPVGARNYLRAFTSPAIRGPFLRIFVWTYAFAVLSVATTFALGLALALALNHPGLRGQRVYRSLLVIPYAIPSFISALVWGGLLNTRFGAINQVLGASIPWLQDPTLARVSVLLVNLWLGFPYMFLICTGALQSIPGDLKEAASVDGAGPFAAFRRITMPLLLVTVSPLLIASFAFNFNNFNIVYLLNRGGPPIAGASTPAGHTDILISYTYRLAFSGQGRADFGFAAAISVLIFVMVAGISAVSFRATKQFEELS